MGLCQSIKKKEVVKMDNNGKIHIRREEKGVKFEVKPVVSISKTVLFRCLSIKYLF